MSTNLLLVCFWIADPTQLPQCQANGISGPGWFRSFVREGSPGTCLKSLTADSWIRHAINGLCGNKLFSEMEQIDIRSLFKVVEVNLLYHLEEYTFISVHHVFFKPL